MQTKKYVKIPTMTIKEVTVDGAVGPMLKEARDAQAFASKELTRSFKQ